MNYKGADWTVQADLRLCCSHMAYTGFLKKWLISCYNCKLTSDEKQGFMPGFPFSILGMGAGSSELRKLVHKLWKLGKVEAYKKIIST